MSPRRPPYIDPAAPYLLRAQAGHRRLLLLDRDGVINIDHGYVHRPMETQWVPGVFEFCAHAHRSGFLPVVVTNQAGIARGYYSEADFLAYTAWVHTEFARQGAPLVATYYCPHHPEYGPDGRGEPCQCRKPAPGMLLAALSDFGADPHETVLIGDKPTDVAAGAAAGVATCHLFSGAWPRLDRLVNGAAT